MLNELIFFTFALFMLKKNTSASKLYLQHTDIGYLIVKIRTSPENCESVSILDCHNSWNQTCSPFDIYSIVMFLQCSGKN